MVNKLERAFSLGYQSALDGELLHITLDSEEEVEEWWTGFREACDRMDDLHSDACE